MQRGTLRLSSIMRTLSHWIRSSIYRDQHCGASISCYTCMHVLLSDLTDCQPCPVHVQVGGSRVLISCCFCTAALFMEFGSECTGCTPCHHSISAQHIGSANGVGVCQVAGCQLSHCLGVCACRAAETQELFCPHAASKLTHENRRPALEFMVPIRL
jgi:hypothetical protein